MEKFKRWRRRYLWRALVGGWLAVLLIAAGVYGLFSWTHPEIKGLDHLLQQAFRNITPTTGWPLVWQILRHNELAALVVILVGLIPLPFLYWYNLTLTAGSIGLVLYLAQMQHQVLGHLILTGLLPHGLIEISCLTLAGGIASELNYYIRSRSENWRRHQNDWVGQLPLRPFLTALGRQYLLIVVPGLVLAAVIEGLITPALLK